MATGNSTSKQFASSALYSQADMGRSEEQQMDARDRWYGKKPKPEPKRPAGMLKMPRFLRG